MRRARCISIVATCFLISQLVGLGVQDIKHLQYAVILVGVSYGGAFGLLPTITIEWFGMGMHSRLLPLELQELTCPSRFLSPNRRTQPTSPRIGASSLYPRLWRGIFSR